MAFDEIFDFVIVGSGAGSVPAALWLKTIGKTAVILEKTDKFGGSTSTSGGVIWAPDNMLMKREGVPDSEEQALTYFDAVVGDVGPASSLARRKAFLAGVNEATQFLEKQGLPFFRPDGYSDYYDEKPGGVARGRTLMAKPYDLRALGAHAETPRRLGVLPVPMNTHEGGRLATVKTTWAGKMVAARVGWRIFVNKLTGRRWVGQGLALQSRLLRIALDNKLDVRLSTPVKDFVVENGAVAGVVAEQDGKVRMIGARDGVLINAGGFSHNAEMRRQYGPQPSSVEWTYSNPGDTGEMIQAAQRLGAAVDLMDEAWWNTVSVPGPGLRAANVADISRPHAMMVDQTGVRYCNESASYMEVGQKQYARHKQVPAVPSWLIFDDKNRRSYPLYTAMPGQTPQEWIDSGYLKKASTIEELARLCDIDPSVLKQTVARFNGFARTGVDEDFHRGDRQYDHFLGGDRSNKPNQNLGAIETAPFYAIQVYPGDVGTAGGLLTDEHARVLTTEGAPIPGLYATGNSTASVMGRSYPGAGASIGASIAFAWNAAHHAARRNQATAAAA
jgi:3-oxosteroid 1-dehydrogenase